MTSVADSDIESSGLLDGLDGAERAQRAELVAWLIDKGFSIEEIRGSFSPMLLASRRHIGDDGVYVSTREMAEQAGIGIDLTQRVQRAIGLPTDSDPDDKVFLKADADAVLHTAKFLELGFDPDQLLQVTRTLAEGLANAAQSMRYTALATVLHAGATELETAEASEAITAASAPLLGPMIEDLLLVQLRHRMETEAVSASERASGIPLPGAREIGVAFADLVDFTRLGEAVEPEELEKLAHRLADMARDVADPPVRFVKTIGDAVMLVSPDPVPLLHAMLELAGAAEADSEFPRLRVGLAYGEAVSRAGDWFGSPVNLASRVTGAARPGTVLASQSAREAIGDADGFEWSYAGARRLKNIKGETRLFRARKSDPEGR
ncbi:MAG TPA: adenylate/guanylate cyclase domain-containing protein [Mycobacterium sp.]|nr:adenylate/guanylate cyclase domain-containing protein [Mycobacterium sp.]